MWHVLFTLLGLWIENITFSVKLAYLGIYFTEKRTRWRLTRLTVLLRLQRFSCFPTLGLNTAKIIDYIEKCFKWKLCRIKFSAKNSVEAYRYLPHPRSIAMRRQTIAMYWNGKVGSFWGWMLPKVTILLKNASNKKCIILNFQQQTQWAQVFFSPRSGAKGP